MSATVHPSPPSAPPGRRPLPRLVLGLLCTLALLATGLGSTTSPAAAASPDVLDVSTLSPGVRTSDTVVGRFVLTATESHPVEVDAQARSGGPHTFTQRLKLNGAGTAERRSVAFSTVGPATLSAYALSASTSADRHLALYDADGTELQRVPAYGAPTDIPLATLTVPAAGSYYVASPASGVNLFHLELTAGEAPERPAWGSVADPVVTDVSVDGADLVVAFDGVVGLPGADLATATAYDADGTAVATGMSGAQGPAGTIRLTPAASGSYTVEVALVRTDEDGAKLSGRTPAPAFSLPLATSEVTSVLTTAVSGGRATVSVDWRAVPEAQGYVVAHRAAGTQAWSELAPVTGTTADLVGLTPGSGHEVRVTALRGEDATTSPVLAFEVAAAVERWLTAHAGVSSNGTLTEHADGSMTFDVRANNGKIADSEDGFLYHYTEIDPETENFTLSATFTVDDAAAKDNQSGFGIIAVDTFVPGDRAARYFNSAGTMAAKYGRTVDGDAQFRYGTPGHKIVDGYTEGPTVGTPARDLSRSSAFDWDYRDGMVEGSNVNPPRFVTGDVYEFTLRRSNTGFHSTWVHEGEVVERIDYDPDLLLQQTEDSFYVGVFAARNIVVSVSDLELTTIHPDDDEEPQERPTTYVTPWLTADVTRTTPHDSLEVPLLSNVHGQARVVDADGTTLGAPVTLEPGTARSVTVPLEDGVNDYAAVLTPAPREEQLHLAEHEDLDSYEPTTIPLEVLVQRYGVPGRSVHVAPDGTPQGDGTPASPLDLHTAVAFAQPGQQVVLASGTYLPESALRIERGRSGTAEAPITLMSEPGGRATLDLSGSPSGGILLRGDHWHLYDLEITRSRGYTKPLLISGHHNVVERIETHHNGDTGLQISGSATEPPSMWPSHNLVLSSVSHNNADPLANDGDGFAAKLTAGEGNVFRYCIAYHNIDDGWDLYAKSTEGPIGNVVVEHSVTFRNGWLEADTERELIGEGNGFKLGGENMPGAHLLHNSVSFDNHAKGVTSNSGPDVQVLDVTSYGNGGQNLDLYTAAARTAYGLRGFLSAEGGRADAIGLRGQEDTLRTDPSNVLDGRTQDGRPVTDDWFVSTDTSLVPRIAADGSIDMQGLLELTDRAPYGTGARLSANPDPTVIVLLPPVGTEEPAPPRGNRPPHAGVPGPPPHAGVPGPPPHAGPPHRRAG